MPKTSTSLIARIHERYPNAAFITSRMIADVMGISVREVRYYCRKYTRPNVGHYRFWLEEEAGKQYLTQPDLERLLRIIVQAKK